MKNLKRIIIAALFLIAAVIMNNAIETAYASSGVGVGDLTEEGSNNC